MDRARIRPSTGRTSHRAVSPPAVRDIAWVRTPIDRFILARLEDKESIPIHPRTAHPVRRACLDLVGLPPAPEEVDAFVMDDSSDAYSKLIDRLLASPHFGERGRGTGSIPPASARATALNRITIALTPIGTATLSSKRSTMTCLTTSSFNGNWRATSLPQTTPGHSLPRASSVRVFSRRN